MKDVMDKIYTQAARTVFTICFEAVSVETP